MTKSLRSIAVVSSVFLGVLASAGVAQARPVPESQINQVCPVGYYLQVAHCEPIPGYGSGRNRAI